MTASSSSSSTRTLIRGLSGAGIFRFPYGTLPKWPVHLRKHQEDSHQRPPQRRVEWDRCGNGHESLRAVFEVRFVLFAEVFERSLQSVATARMSEGLKVECLGRSQAACGHRQVLTGIVFVQSMQYHLNRTLCCASRDNPSVACMNQGSELKPEEDRAPVLAQSRRILPLA